jgi:hypothetical protein
MKFLVLLSICVCTSWTCSFDSSVIVIRPAVFGSGSGSLLVSVQGTDFTNNVTHAWSSGEISQNLTNVAAGEYSLNVSDGSCSVMLGPIVLSQPGDSNADCKVDLGWLLFCF